MNLPNVSIEQAMLIARQLESDIPYYSKGLDILLDILETETEEDFNELCKQNGLEGATMNEILSQQANTSELLTAIQNYLKDVRSSPEAIARLKNPTT